ncbi:type II toxin-antitoxin system tRNA(fMet)-specific endonuclease VapC [Deinococcus cellulosilyticus]|uniref:Ribonuclease VapC n=1 Tax=Deinococcus cellulosilyticus (strain DSM 18568 / NBRC 106333 / KACC 11606 / 5516J-15) TaxID=1223518 RepID=A0A511MY32_DEIC1|nr:type II toxin-antitoxin system VapC family toxin [Deinococcus cellulosilyticus]GEM45463.1 ribonuclease VapC [Deinococcus cellulosilyticus NBRC 106333 = KACC 11606]
MSLEVLLDTNTCIFILNHRPPQVAERFAEHPIGSIGVSSITAAELSFGMHKSGSEKNLERLKHFLTPLAVLPFDDEAARVYGRVRAELQARGTPIGPLDTLIGAHALALGATLVTNNTREFKRISGLALEDWL